MCNTIEELQMVIADGSLGLPERRTAAEHYVDELLEAVPAPAEDDAEVVELTKIWTDDGPLGSLLPKAWRLRNEFYGWSADGPTLTQCKQHIHERMKLRALLGIIVDESAHRLERLEACRCVLGRLSPRNDYRMNSYTPERMLDATKLPTAVKWGTGGKVPVERPPREIADVW